jgi:DNA-binding GntR family transcriptional regulator
MIATIRQHDARPLVGEDGTEMARTKTVRPTAVVPARQPVDLNLRTFKRAVFETLRDMCVSFELEPGDRLVETDLAARLGVSKTPVREALFMLESEGLVDVTPYRGATVRWLSTNEMAEQGYLIDALEMPAYPIVVERITDRELAELDEAAERLRQARRDGDEIGFGQHAVDIHTRIFSATGYPRLTELIRLVLGPTGLRYDKALVYPDPTSWDLLLELALTRVQAVQERDAQKAIESVSRLRAQLSERTAARLTDPSVARYFREAGEE